MSVRGGTSSFMKIDAIVRSKSDDRQTAFRTIPPLTEEVFGCALQNYLGGETGVYWSHEGLFIVARTVMGAEQIQEFEAALTKAEELLDRQKANPEKPGEKALQERSQKTGLPIVD